MLNKIKNYFIGISAGLCIAVAAYIAGKQKGKSDEKIKNAAAVHENVVRAMRARALLRDPDFVRRLRAKYGRE